ncbi:ABC transporter permease [Desertivibrio insolitus]|uniref:ABC transporter permease n=1 Tax=Herbiconiux sp. SYSU D00978 TaxID=2812562 RepID=UPI001A95CDF7|nr:ABC transporter permease [Herbiconiux sp. SYSU D00978]
MATTTPTTTVRADVSAAGTRSISTFRLGRGLKTLWPPLAVLAAIILGWYVLSLVVLAERNFLLPPPHEIFTEALFNPGTAADIFLALWRTALVAVTGLAIAIVLGIVWAVAMSQARWVERSLFPYAVILQCIPILALVPLIGFWFGFNFEARTIVCVLIALFPMVSNTLFGLQSVEKSQRELFQLQGASRWTVLTKLQLPAALPAIFAGMRISAGLAVVGAIVGDFFFRRGTPGIGSLLSDYTSRIQSAELFAAIIVACLFGVAVFVLFGWIGRRAVGRWYESNRG